MYLRAILCTGTFQISVDFYYVPLGRRGGGRGGAGEGVGTRERGIVTINVPLFKKLRDIIFFVGQ
jgi:hypothetical protein